MPSPAKKRAAAKQRLGQRKPAETLGSRFANIGTRSGTPRYDVPIQARVGDELASALADYGNAHGLCASDTIRHLLEVGLEKEKKHRGK